MIKKIITAVVLIGIIGVGLYFITKSSSYNTDIDNGETPTATPTPSASATTSPSAELSEGKTVIGKSVEGRDIEAQIFGKGDTELLFIGGIHGGYSWNTVLVAYELVDYLTENPDKVPDNVKVTVIPVLNPDGLFETVGTSTRFAKADVPTSDAKLVAGRFNANTVDLNRNFDCDWQAVGKWQNKDVSGGSSVFSEPESQALKNYVERNEPEAVVVWYSAAGGVYASNCHNDVSSKTSALTNTYAKASGYPAHESFDFYEITGDMVNWFAKNDIPAISVLLTNHTDVEWSKNRAGIDAVLEYFAK